MTLIAIPWVASPLPTSSVKLLTQQPYGRGRVDDVLLVGQFQLSESLNLVNVHDSLDPRHHRQVHLADFALGKHHHAAMVRRGREGGLSNSTACTEAMLRKAGKGRRLWANSASSSRSRAAASRRTASPSPWMSFVPPSPVLITGT